MKKSRPLRMKKRTTKAQGQGRPVQEDQASDEDNPEDQGEAVREMEAASEDEEKLEPEKEKNPQPQAEEAYLDYCSMEAIAERWRDKPKKTEAAPTNPEFESETDQCQTSGLPPRDQGQEKPHAAVSRTTANRRRDGSSTI